MGESLNGPVIASLEPPELYRIAKSPGFLGFAAIQELYRRKLPWPAISGVGSESNTEERSSTETLGMRDLGLVVVKEYDVIGFEGAEVTMINGIPTLETEQNEDDAQNRDKQKKRPDDSMPFFFEMISGSGDTSGHRALVFASPRGVLRWSHAGRYDRVYRDPWPFGDAPGVFQVEQRTYKPNIQQLKGIGMKKEGIDRALMLSLMTHVIHRAQGSGIVIIKPDQCQVLVIVSGRTKPLETIGGVRVEAISYGLPGIKLVTADGRQLQPPVDRLRVPSGADPFETAVQTCYEVIGADAARRPKQADTIAKLLNIPLSES